MPTPSVTPLPPPPANPASSPSPQRAEAPPPDRSFRRALDEASRPAAPPKPASEQPKPSKTDAKVDEQKSDSKDPSASQETEQSADKAPADGSNAKPAADEAKPDGKTAADAEAAAAKKIILASGQTVRGRSAKDGVDSAVDEKVTAADKAGSAKPTTPVAAEQTPTDLKPSVQDPSKPSTAAKKPDATVVDPALAQQAAQVPAQQPTAPATSEPATGNVDAPKVDQLSPQLKASSHGNAVKAGQPDAKASASAESAAAAASSTGAVATTDSSADQATNGGDPGVASVDAAKPAGRAIVTADHPSLNLEGSNLAGVDKTASGQSSSTGARTEPARTPEAQFVETNHPQIISAVSGQLLPNGGSMHIRLDPPELGALQITVKMRDGVMSASFQASNEQAARLLSHSLGDLKNQLEAQGVNIDKLHVTQTPRAEQPASNNSGSDSNRNNSDGATAEHRREQQRRELLQRMWRRLSGDNDPLDLVA